MPHLFSMWRRRAMKLLVAIVNINTRNPSNVLVYAVFMISAPINTSRPTVKYRALGANSIGFKGSLTLAFTYRDVSKIEPKRIKPPDNKYRILIMTPSTCKTMASKSNMYTHSPLLAMQRILTKAAAIIIKINTQIATDEEAPVSS
jgi:hypothetical protein